jgi:2-polyprenyl-3-methyl-5-hydroxy-6-metoxy-1,4-benzoquinol methylase
MAVKKYSKSSSFYLKSKQDFFTSNEELLHRSHAHNDLYASQPKRQTCKICQSTLPHTIDFHSHNVDYVFCEVCSHLNGCFEDTKSFFEKVYLEGEVEYSKNYIDDNYLQRTTDIYIPKVDFLVSTIPTKKFKILDVGCGGGYFVFASLLRNISASGLDINNSMVEFGNSQIFQNSKQKPLLMVEESDFYEQIKDSNADIVSAIGVIEHLREPQKFFEAFQKSSAQYLYYCVPMFSLTVALENVFTNVFPRQLSADHTHLFTESSISKMNNLIGVKSIGEWRFGTDSMDLYRHLLINLQANQSSQKMIDFLHSGFGEKIDEIQSIFDENHFCSEIHVIASKM